MMKYRLSFYLLFLFTMFFSQDKFYFDKRLQKQDDSILEIIMANPKLGLKAAEKFRLICQKKKNPLYEASAMALIDFSYLSICDFKNLLKSTKQTILFSKKYSLYRQTFEASTRKANALTHLGLLQDAEKIFKQNTSLAGKFNETDLGLETVAIFWSNYAEFYNAQQKDNEAISMLNKSVLSYQKIKNNNIRNLHLTESYSNIGSLYLFQEKIDSAFSYFKKAENLFRYEKMHNKNSEAMVFAGYGMGYNIKKKYKEAIPYLIKSLELCKKNGYKDIYVETLNQLSISYSNIKDKNGDIYYKKFLKAQEEYSTNNKLTAEEFEKVKENNSSFYERNKYYIWSVSGFLLIGFLGITFYQVKKQKKSEKEKTEISEVVKEQSEEISTLKTKVNEGFEEVLELAKTNDPSFMKRFSEVYPDFFKFLADEHPKLTSTQLKILAYSFLNFKTKDIASYTNVAVRTVDTHKYRIRKIINIDSEEDLISWAQKNGYHLNKT